jgi:hypothetical protein
MGRERKSESVERERERKSEYEEREKEETDRQREIRLEKGGSKKKEGKTGCVKEIENKERDR